VHGCLVFMYVRFSVCVQVEALRRADHPPKESYRLSMIQKRKPKWNGEFHGGRPRPIGAVLPMKKKYIYFFLNRLSRYKSCLLRIYLLLFFNMQPNYWICLEETSECSITEQKSIYMRNTLRKGHTTNCY
jgi:hypothetical protein